ncbi:unnamed protein product, partial [Mesorhabditis belari]|uniref:Membrane transporter protein n=1 Tax=Mesorhabditis belari TaxID=2138241 RepID=A0AAF3FAW7_9BILA
MSLNSPVKKPRKTLKEFIGKYFLEGQILEIEKEFAEKPSWWDSFHEKHRKFIALLIPFVFIQSIWILTAFRFDFFRLYPTRWQIPLTMIFGSCISGMTSAGGGAVAFPVMTLLLNIDANTSRDYALMQQSIGMSTSMFVIVYMQIVVEKRAILLCGLGSIPGIIVGLTWLDELFNELAKKTFFIAVGASFAISLYMLNSEKKRIHYQTIPEFNTWKALVLLITGYVGGICTALTGTGLDIVVFAILTLLFRVSEKTATPTTVVLQAINSIMGFYWRAIFEGHIPQLAWEYLAVTTPVSATMAPLGSFLGSHFHRLVLAFMIYALEYLSVLGFLATQPPWEAMAIGAAIVVCGFIFFVIIMRIGKRIQKGVEKARHPIVAIRQIRHLEMP